MVIYDNNNNYLFLQAINITVMMFIINRYHLPLYMYTIDIQ